MDSSTLIAALTSVAAYEQIQRNYMQISDILNAVDTSPADLNGDCEGEVAGTAKRNSRTKTDAN